MYIYIYICTSFLYDIFQIDTHQSTATCIVWYGVYIYSIIYSMIYNNIFFYTIYFT